MKFSASELVKRSASQLLYKEIKKIEFEATPRQYRGNTYADEVVKKEEASAEKRGIVTINDDLLFFCIDMVKKNKFVEIKMVEDMETVEDWYLNSSILQSTLYATLLTKVKTLDTPKFRKKEGYKQEVLVMPDKWGFELWFGTDKYQIFPDERIYEHYINKMQVIKDGVKSGSYDNCRVLDAKYKFKEFSIYKPKFKELKVKVPQLLS
jgi:hypothetical protein